MFRFILALSLVLPLIGIGAEVGVAAVDVTPDYPVRLSGYGSRRDFHKGISQRIYAKALAFSAEKESAAAVIVTVDNCGVPQSMRDAVRAEFKDSIPDQNFTICSSHTHCAPMLDGILPNLFSMDIPAEHQASITRYTKDLKTKLIKVVRAALDARQPGDLAWAVGRVGFAANRRSFPTKPVDHSLPVLRVTDPNGKVRAILTNYACHCTTVALDDIHGDWAGCAQEALQREFPGAIALTAIGCGADQNPTPRRTMELVKQYGEDLAAEASRLISGDMKPIRGSIRCQAVVTRLDYSTLPTLAEWQTLATSSTASIAYHAKKNLQRLQAGEVLPTGLDYMVQSWAFGTDLAMVFLPGEVTVDYSLRIKREFDSQRLWVSAYSNDVPCYIPSRRVWEEGGYEGAGAMVYYDRPTKFASDVEDRIIKAVHEVVPEGFRQR
jgi:neutral ceramidase